jgi:hypothetical protein
LIHILACEPHGPCKQRTRPSKDRLFPLSNQACIVGGMSSMSQVTEAPPTPMATWRLPVHLHPARHTVVLPLPSPTRGSYCNFFARVGPVMSSASEGGTQCHVPLVCVRCAVRHRRLGKEGCCGRKGGRRSGSHVT